MVAQPICRIAVRHFVDDRGKDDDGDKKYRADEIHRSTIANLALQFVVRGRDINGLRLQKVRIAWVRFARKRVGRLRGDGARRLRSGRGVPNSRATLIGALRAPVIVRADDRTALRVCNIPADLGRFFLLHNIRRHLQTLIYRDRRIQTLIRTILAILRRRTSRKICCGAVGVGLNNGTAIARPSLLARNRNLLRNRRGTARSRT